MHAARLDDESGTVLVLSALFMAFVFIPVLIVLVLGVAGWRTHERHLQLEADAAALAGGDLLGECFSSNGGPSGTADADIQAEADRYVGVSGTSFNQQLAGATSLGRIYNSPIYADGHDPGPDGTVAGTSCQPPYMFDVKASEQISGLTADFIPGLSVTPRAHARVQLFKANIAAKALPVVVPEANPTHVFVTLTDLKNNGSLATCPLTGPVSNGSLNMWTSATPCTFTMPTADDDVGVRVGVGTAAGSCGFGSAGGAGYTCYNETDTSTPLAIIRSYSTSGTAPFVASVTESTCGWSASSPFFSEIDPSPCGATVTADVRWGTSCPLNKSCMVQATDSQGTTAQSPCTQGPSAMNIYQFPFSYLTSAGQVTIVSLQYKVRSNSTCAGGSFNTQLSPYAGSYQQAYGADSDPTATGPIEVLAASSYAFTAGSQSVSFTVGLLPPVSSLTPPYPPLNSRPIGLRLLTKGTQVSTLVNCDSQGFNGIRQAIINGCNTGFQTQPAPGSCPDSASPADCVPIFPGNGANGLAKQVFDAFDTRFSPCPANNLLNYTSTDPRIAQILFTDLQQLLANQGAGKIPITDLGSFYITGWGYQNGANPPTLGNCAGNDPPPTGLLKPGVAAIWGHFIPYVNPQDTGNNPCPSPPGITPCVPELTQ